MSEDLNRIQQRARDLARSGKFVGSRAVTFELQFEPGYAQAFGWLHNLERRIRSPLRRGKNAHQPRGS